MMFRVFRGRNGSGFAPNLRPDARTEMGNFDGRVRDVGRSFRYYAIVQGVDKIVPVDGLRSGLSAATEMLVHAIMMASGKVERIGQRRRDTYEANRAGRTFRGLCPYRRNCSGKRRKQTLQTKRSRPYTIPSRHEKRRSHKRF